MITARLASQTHKTGGEIAPLRGFRNAAPRLARLEVRVSASLLPLLDSVVPSEPCACTEEWKPVQNRLMRALDRPAKTSKNVSAWYAIFHVGAAGPSQDHAAHPGSCCRPEPRYDFQLGWVRREALGRGENREPET